MNDKRVRENTSPQRIPLAEQNKSVLTVPKKEGFVRRWVMDDKRTERVNAFLRAGWRIVTDMVDVGTDGVVNQNQSLSTGARKSDRSGSTLILMEIERRYYDEDQAVKMARIDEIERAIYGGEGIRSDLKIGNVEVEDRYVTTK